MLSQEHMKALADMLPFMQRLTPEQKQTVLQNAHFDACEPGFLYQTGVDECKGLVLVLSGQLRAYYASDDGKEITLYRLLSGDSCVMTMSCVLRSITFDISLEAEKPSSFITIPVRVFKLISEENAAVREYELEQVSSRFSDVFWVMEQVVFKGMGQRVAAFLLEQSAIEGADVLPITHEKAAKELGTAREVISRMLKYFEGEGLIRQSRGRVTLTDIKGLRKLSQ